MVKLLKEATMREIAISVFKAQCLAILEGVRRSHEPICVTRFGVPVAQVSALEPSTAKRRLGSMVGTAQIVGDIISPISDPSDWNVLKP